MRSSPPRGLASEAWRSRVPPTVAPGSMTAQVGLVLGQQTRGESAGCTAAASSGSVLVPCWFPCPPSPPSPPRRSTQPSPPTTPEGCASAAAIPPRHWSTRSTSRDHVTLPHPARARKRVPASPLGSDPLEAPYPARGVPRKETAVTTETRHGEHRRGEKERSPSTGCRRVEVTESPSPPEAEPVHRLFLRLVQPCLPAAVRAALALRSRCLPPSLSRSSSSSSVPPPLRHPSLFLSPPLPFSTHHHLRLLLHLLLLLLLLLRVTPRSSVHRDRWLACQPA